ncbi:MAG: hypothetical protein R3B36_35470 [Polyangiaceae bacterium]
MPQVTVRIYRSDNAGATRTLVRTLRVDTRSAKPLTSRRAVALLRREVPGFERAAVIAVAGGWCAKRTLRPTEACGYHYVWEEVEITQDEGRP